MSSSNRFISLSLKLSILFAAFPVIVIPLITYFSTTALISAYEETTRRLGITVTRNVASLVENAVKEGDYTFQSRALRDTIGDQTEFVDAVLLKGCDAEFTYEKVEQQEEGKEGFELDPQRLQRLCEADPGRNVLTQHYNKGKSRRMDFIKDIFSGAESKYRRLVFGVSMERLEERRVRTWLSALLLTVACSVLSILLGILMSRTITQPLKKLVQEAATISSGNLDNEIQVHSSDEVGLLAHAFQQMRISLKNQIAEIAKKAMSLEGDLRVFALPDLMQFICTAGRTGRLVVDDRGTEAHIYFLRGEIFHGDTGNVVGQEAVFQLFNLPSGAFRFESGEFDVERTIVLPWQHVIMEGARQTDEMNRIRQLIPSTDLRVEVSEPPDGMSQINLTPEEMQVSLLARDGNTVADILEISPLEEMETYQILYRLISTGLLKAGK